MTTVVHHKDYVEPVVTSSVETLDFYEVKTLLFLNKASANRKAKTLKTTTTFKHEPITVYSVGDEKFLDKVLADKKVASLVKKERERIRLIARFYGVDKASYATKIPHLVWLIENYTFDELRTPKWLKVFNDETAIRERFARRRDYEVEWNKGRITTLTNSGYPRDKYIKELEVLLDGLQKAADPLDTTVPLSYYYNNRTAYLPDLEESDSVAHYMPTDKDGFSTNYSPLTMIQHMDIRNEWPWLSNIIIDCGAPKQYGAMTPERIEWVDSARTLGDNIYGLPAVFNYRAGELLAEVSKKLSQYDSNGQLVSVPSIENVLEQIPASSLIDEFNLIKDFLMSNELGRDFHMKTLKGAPVYWVNDESKNINPFKQF